MRVARLAIGLAVWLVAAALLPVAPAAVGLLVVPLILVPHWLATISPRLGWVALAAAVPLAAAFSIEPGVVPGLLAVPWLATCALLAIPAVIHGARSLPSILHPSRADVLLADASPVLLAVGATFCVLDRLAFGVLGLDQNMVLVTAVHFHVLGFGLISVASSLSARGFRLARAAAYPFLAGIPLTAAGFTLDSTLLQWLGSILVVAAGLLVVGALAQSAGPVLGWRRAGSLLAAGTLLVGVPMGLLWASAMHFGIAFVDFGTMVATHGALNTIGTALAFFAVRDRPM